MGPLRGALLLALLCLACMPTPTTSEQCEEPDWDNSAGPNPFTERRGKVVLVAFLKGYCRYCINQVGKMHRLKERLIQEGYPDIDMIIINGGEPRSRNLVNNLINASPIPVIQDTLSHTLYREVFMANKDDFLVYDRCNQAAIYIPHPWSDLRNNITKRVLKAVHDGRHSCYCSLDNDPVDMNNMMMGDDPGVRFYQTHNMNRNMIHCSSDDYMCLAFQSVISRRRGNRPSGSNLGTRAMLRRRLCNLRRRTGNGSTCPARRGYFTGDGGLGMGRTEDGMLGRMRRRFGSRRNRNGGALTRRRGNSQRRNHSNAAGATRNL